jgi:hypothetical protein
MQPQSIHIDQEGTIMTQTFSKVAGVIQAILGVLGTASPETLGTQTGGSIFNLLSGAALSYLGFKGTDANQRLGAQVLGGANGLVGLLGAFGGIEQGTLATIVNLAVGAWGLYAGFAKKQPAQ